MLVFCGAGLLQHNCLGAREYMITWPSCDCWLPACWALELGALDGVPLARVAYLKRQWQNTSQLSPAATTLPVASRQHIHLSSTVNTATAGLEPVSPTATWFRLLMHTPIRLMHAKRPTSLAFLKVPQPPGQHGSSACLCGQETARILPIAWLPAALPVSVVASGGFSTLRHPRVLTTLVLWFTHLSAVLLTIYMGDPHQSAATGFTPFMLGACSWTTTDNSRSTASGHHPPGVPTWGQGQAIGEQPCKPGAKNVISALRPEILSPRERLTSGLKTAICANSLLPINRWRR